MHLRLLIASLSLLAPKADDYFTIEVVDEATGRGVPLVELRSVDQTTHVTDSNGLVAYYEQGLMDQKVFFHVQSHGYEFPADGFGFRGQAVQVAAGGSTQLRIRRLNVAERLYRVTGEGIYRDTVLLGKPAAIKQPLLNAQVVGSDSVNTAVFRGKVYWFWGDTNRPAYPLGTFHVPGATSRLPADGGLDPSRGVDLQYFMRDDGFAASTCEMPGEGPTWIDGLCVIDDTGRQRMFAKYVKVRKFLEVYERGLVEFQPDKQRFEKVTTFDFAAPLYPHGHALAREVDGRSYVYFGNPYPHTRVAATADALADPQQHEAFTCLSAGSSLERPTINRDAQGAARWSWQRNTPAVTPQLQAKWLARGLLKTTDAVLALRDVETGKPLVAHAGSVAWNAHRKRFVMIVEQSQGTSPLGEIWYAEADAPTGPWIYARKVVTHEKYSFYNPKQHAMLDADGGRTIYFEGTYTTLFSGNDHPTPRYDYNQIMYRLDLADPRLALPVAVYESAAGEKQRLATGSGAVGRITFMALDRPSGEALAVVRRDAAGNDLLMVEPAPKAEEAPVTQPRAEIEFYALPPDTAKPPKTAVALYAWRHVDGRVRCAVDGNALAPDFKRDEKPLCLVWRYPLSPNIDWQ